MFIDAGSKAVNHKTQVLAVCDLYCRISSERYFRELNTDAIVYKSFWNIVKLCERNDVFLIVVVGPKYPWLGIYPQNQLVVDTQAKMRGYRMARLIHVSPELYPIFQEKELYQDSVHLNGSGADILSRLISDTVLQIEIGCVPYQEMQKQTGLK